MIFATVFCVLFLVIGILLCFMDAQAIGLTLILICSINIYQFHWADHRAPIVKQQEKCEADGFTWQTTNEVILQGGHHFLNGVCVP